MAAAAYSLAPACINEHFRRLRCQMICGVPNGTGADCVPSRVLA